EIEGAQRRHVAVRLAVFEMDDFLMDHARLLLKSFCATVPYFSNDWKTRRFFFPMIGKSGIRPWLVEDKQERAPASSAPAFKV
ncbi:MAG: hypothetical protein KJ726_00020, partial [Verrucomicrobia bacterium]|nr:hypothetical protein [Verrucomicrobiota bacterium]